MLFRSDIIRSMPTETGYGNYSAPGSPPNKQSGKLSQSISWETVGRDGHQITVSAGGYTFDGKPVVYAKFLENGGIVRAKNAKMLAIPVHPLALQKARVGKGPRDCGVKLFVMKRKHDNGKKQACLARKVGRGGKNFEVWYVLKKSVNVAARPFMRPAFNRAKGYAVNVFANAATANFGRIA